jgi:hypothetical protein
MKVSEEAITVLRDSDGPGLTLLMGGYRVALTVEEARSLLRGLRSALAEGPGEAEAAEPTDRAIIVAKVTEQMISWAKIADATQRP